MMVAPLDDAVTEELHDGCQGWTNIKHELLGSPCFYCCKG